MRSGLKNNPSKLTVNICVIVSIYLVFFIGREYGKKEVNSLFSMEMREFIRNFLLVQQYSYKEIDEKYLLKIGFESILKELNDPYTGIINNKLNLDYKVANGKLFVANADRESLLKPNDEIIAINGVDLQDKPESEIVETLKNMGNKQYVFKIKRENKIEDIALKDNPEENIIEVHQVKIMKDNSNEMAYIPISTVSDDMFVWLEAMLNKIDSLNIKSLILDLRNCPGGNEKAQNNILSLFLDTTHPIYQIEYRDKSRKMYYAKGKEDKEYNIVILINNKTASAGEIIATALSEQYGAKIIGEKSFGKGVGQTNAKSLNYDFQFTSQKWYTSKGEWIGEKGITPDILVKNKHGKDNQLQEAIKYLSEK